MKSLFIIICLFFVIPHCMGQKKLSDVKLSSIFIEEIDPRSIPDIKAYQIEKFKQPRTQFLATIKLMSNEYTKSYKLSGSDDLIVISSRLHGGALESWEQDVKTAIEMFTPINEGIERYENYTEYIEGDDFKSVIYFTKNYKLDNINYISYINKGKGIILWIRYISNSSDEVKIDNMRKIIKDLKIE